MKKVCKILTFLCLFEVFIFLLSYLPFFNLSSAEKKTESALLNKKYEKNITEISITKSKETLILQNRNAVWTGNISDFSFTTNQINVNRLIKELIKVIDMYKISDSVKYIQHLKLESSEVSDVTVTIKGNDGSIYSKIYFNLDDISLKKLRIRSDSSLSVYEIEDNLSTFLTTSPEFWGDSFIIPQSIFGNILQSNLQRVLFQFSSDKKIVMDKKNFNSLLSLRHGNYTNAQLYASLDKDNPMFLQAELGDKSSLKIDFYPVSNSSGDFLLHYSFYPSDIINPSQSAIIKNISYDVLISSWTFERIVNLFATE